MHERIGAKVLDNLNDASKRAARGEHEVFGPNSRDESGPAASVSRRVSP